MALDVGQRFYGAMTGGGKPYPRGRRTTAPVPGVNLADYPAPAPARTPREWWSARFPNLTAGRGFHPFARNNVDIFGRYIGPPLVGSSTEYIRPGAGGGTGIVNPPVGRTGGPPKTPTIPTDARPPVNRPNAQYYNAAALRAAAPNAVGAQPGWYGPEQIDRWASLLGPDQLRGLMPLIQAEAARLGTGTPVAPPDPSAWLRANYPNISPYDIESAPNALGNPDAWSQNLRGTEGAAERYRNLPTTTTPSNLSVWQRLAGQFPGLSLQGNEFSNQVIPGFNSRATPEQQAARTTEIARRNAVAPPGMAWTALRNASLVGSSYGYRPIPGYTPPPPTGYRGGILRGAR